MYTHVLIKSSLLPIVSIKTSSGGFSMSLPSQSAPTMPTAQNALTTCPRCGMVLPHPGIACNQRTCRPAALRRVTLVPFVILENDVNQRIDHVHGDLLRIS
jgi:hypothetical protein